jgi:GalNAc-alpha-(1->4)-GalNAc-alpha-(1->3)-diNAcBac-PP-undecaprenol alpha-1,4-N-acetyl-D-galactosaminyltransferase
MVICLVVSSLGAGGAERVVTTMANYWVGRGRKVILVTLDDGRSEPAYRLDPAISWRALNLMKPSRNLLHGLFSNLRRIVVLRRALVQARPDVVISFIDQTNILVILASMGLSVPVIVSERVDPARHAIAWPWSKLRQVLYPRAACLIVQTANMLRHFSPAVQRLAQIIPNPVVPPVLESTKGVLREKETMDRRRVAGLGRLVPQKGFDILIRAFAIVASRFPKWELVIWGEGPERSALESLRDQLGLVERVSLPGLTKHPEYELWKSDLFVLSSRYEGFPNALLEAMVCGLPVISFDCPTGPSDIIQDDIDGLLVQPEDEDALARAMFRLMSDEHCRRRLGAQAVRVVERFGLDQVGEAWEKVLRQVVAGCADRKKPQSSPV